MMYKINNQLKDQKYKQLQIQKLIKTDTVEILGISLEKGTTFPEQISPTELQLIALEGKINFNIIGKTYEPGKHHHFSFQKEVPHWVSAEENSKFLIVR